MDAHVWFNFPGRNGEGDVKYQAAGGNYWFRATADHRLGLAPNLESAYDGQHYQVFYLDDSRLSLWKKDPGQAPAPFPNPLYLPVSFLGLSGDSCEVCDWKVEELRGSVRWNQQLRSARSVSAGTLLLAGGDLHGKPFFYRVSLDDGGAIQTIQSVFSTGKTFRTVELTDYQQAEGSPRKYPFHLLVSTFDEEGRILATIHYRVTSLSFNDRIHPEKFTLSRETPQVVIDEDGPAFLKHPQLARPASPPEGQ